MMPRRREDAVKVMLTSTEREWLETLAEHEGQDLSNYLRHHIRRLYRLHEQSAAKRSKGKR